LATLIIFLLGGIIIFILNLFILPSIFEQLQRIQRELTPEKLHQYIANLNRQLKDFLPAGVNLNIKSEADNLIKILSSGALAFAVSLLSTLSYLVVVPVAVFFFIKDGFEMKKSFIKIIPNQHFEMVLNIIHKIDIQLGGYLRGILIDALVIGTLATIALWIIGVPYFVLIGLFAGLANMIPYVGPLAGTVLAVTVNFISSGSFDMAIPILAAFAVIQIIDNALVQPYVISKNVAINPVTIIFAILIGGSFFGLLGMFFAVPVVSILKVTLWELYRGIQSYNS
jgi:predicted PurR-regulated permease PerM